MTSTASQSKSPGKRPLQFVHKFRRQQKTQISVRIDSEIKKDFDAAVKQLHAHQLTMEVTELVEEALRSATNAVFKQYGAPDQASAATGQSATRPADTSSLDQGSQNRAEGQATDAVPIAAAEDDNPESQ